MRVCVRFRTRLCVCLYGCLASHTLVFAQARRLCFACAVSAWLIELRAVRCCSLRRGLERSQATNADASGGSSSGGARRQRMQQQLRMDREQRQGAVNKPDGARHEASSVESVGRLTPKRAPQEPEAPLHRGRGIEHGTATTPVRAAGMDDGCVC